MCTLRPALPPLVLLAGCAATRPALPAATAALPGDDGARAAIATVVQAQYAAIERGDLDAWAAAFTDDALLLGTDPSEVMVGRAAIAARMKDAAAARMAANVRRTYRSQRLRVGVTPSGEAGWATDWIEYTVDTRRAVTFRMTAVLARREGRYRVLCAHYSVPVPDEEAFARPSPEPADLGAGAAPPVAPPASPEEASALAALRDLVEASPPGHFPGLFSDRADTILVATDPKEWIEGGAAVQRFTGQGLPAKIELVVHRPARVGVAERGQLGWAAYNATLTVPAGDRRVALPVRVLSAFLREPAGWRKVQEHVSLAVPDA